MEVAKMLSPHALCVRSCARDLAWATLLKSCAHALAERRGRQILSLHRWTSGRRRSHACFQRKEPMVLRSPIGSFLWKQACERLRRSTGAIDNDVAGYRVVACFDGHGGQQAVAHAKGTQHILDLWIRGSSRRAASNRSCKSRMLATFRALHEEIIRSAVQGGYTHLFRPPEIFLASSWTALPAWCCALSSTRIALEELQSSAEP